MTPTPIDSDAALHWVSTVGGLLLSWPTVGLLTISLFFKPLSRLAYELTEGGRVISLRLGQFQVHRKLDQLTVQGHELREEIKHQEERLGEQQEIINKLVVYSMSASIYRHLWHIARSPEYLYRNEPWFQRQMYFLSDNGFVQPTVSPFLIFDQTLEGKNLAAVSKPTPIGEFLVRLRGEPPELVVPT
jgi:hypothetical protein